MIALANPWALLALVSVPIIVVLYSLRPERRTVVLSSTALWQEALRERQRGFGWQKLLRNLSLLALLLFALLASFGLADPGRIAGSALPGDAIVVVDVSASMQARDGDGTRFDRARAEARALVDALPENARLLLIASGREPRLLSAFEGDRRVLGEALAALEAGDEAGNPAAAIKLARSLMRSRERGRIYFVTDAAFDDRPGAAGPGVEYRVVGTPAPNVAITRFDVRREIGADDRFQVLLTVRNYAPDAVEVPVVVAVDDRPFFERRLALPAGGRETVVVPFSGRIVGRASARIDHDDALDVDDQAFAVLGTDENLQIALYSAGNFYLESALAALPNAIVNRRAGITPAGLEQDARVHDLVVLDGVDAPPLPPGNFLLVDTVPPGGPISEVGPVVARAGVAGTGTSALVRGLDLSGVRIDAARRVVVKAGATGVQRMFWSPETPLGLAYIEGDVRAVYVGFDLARSNFPLQAAFPLFVEHAAAWLRGAQSRLSRTQIEAGEPYVIRLPAAQRTLVMRTPAGAGEIYDVTGGEFVFDATTRTGLYRYAEEDAFGEVARYLAVNLTDERESDITPRASLPEPMPTAPEAATLAKVTQPLWPFLVALALLALVSESCLAMRRRRDA